MPGLAPGPVPEAARTGLWPAVVHPIVCLRDLRRRKAAGIRAHGILARVVGIRGGVGILVFVTLGDMVQLPVNFLVQFLGLGEDGFQLHAVPSADFGQALSFIHLMSHLADAWTQIQEGEEDTASPVN